MAVPSFAKLDQDRPVLLPAAQGLLRDALRAQGKTVTALAFELGISRKHCSNVLNGHAPLLEPLLGRVAQVTGVDPVLLRAAVRTQPTRPPGPYGAMRGTIEVLDDPTAPMEHWEMLED